MSDPITIKRGDTGRMFTTLILKDDGTPEDLTGRTIWFVFSTAKPKTLLARNPAVVLDPATSLVGYAPQTVDVSVTGTFLVEWEMEKDGLFLTFPRASYQTLVIITDLNPPTVTP